MIGKVYKPHSIIFATFLLKIKAHYEAPKKTDRIRDMFDNIPIGIFESTQSGQFHYVNRATASMLGYDSPEELIEAVNGSSISEVFV